jgi:pyruvate,water dikinase
MRSVNPMTALILHFDQVKKTHRNQVGGKGYALSQLSRAGFPVPMGFVVTIDAFRTHTAANGLDALVTEALIGDDPSAASARIGMAFEAAEIPSAIVASICQAYLALGEGEVAVRSSALAEDHKAASFAGQHETLLGVVGDDALLAAVRRCWASLWSERALAYRRRLDHEDDGPAMAVVVQRMVSAAQAGVAFTLDPVSGCRDVVVVEAVAGPGEALVSGQATPCRYVVQSDDNSEAGEGVLDVAGLAAVVRLAKEVESWAGQPQDIEWALDEAGRVHLLQARPITVSGAASPESATRWTRNNVGEVLPDPVTPLSWSVLDPLGNRSFTTVIQRLGIGDYPDASLFGRFHGRVYFNQTLFQAMMSRFYVSQAGWRAAPRLALAALRALWLLRSLPGEGEEVIKAILELRRSEEGPDISALVPADLLARLTSWRRLGAEAMEIHLAVTVIAELLYQALDKLLARWGDGTTTVATLTSGLTGVRSAEAGRTLAVLAQQICGDDDLRALVLTTTPEALPAQLAETEAGRALWDRFETFLAGHGHCAVQEFELAAPRWRDDSTITLSLLQAQVRAAGEGPVADPTAARVAATTRIERRLGPLKRWVLRCLLHRAQAFAVARENLKYHFVMAHSQLRDLYLALAAQLVAAGQLALGEDVFFLTGEEVMTLIEERVTPGESRERVAERRKAWEVDRQTVPPSAFDQQTDGRICEVTPPAAPDASSSSLLRGLAASTGTHTGRARVVLTPADGADIEPGEVLVTSAVSPGWAPLLLAAGALVTEMGGTLSHGAIIAREYGLPAVLDVSDATHRICTGQLVYVDGARGIIRLLGDESPEGGAGGTG